MHLRKRADAISLPTIVNPTGKFDGNDGKWSTFSINVNSDSKGQDGQNFRVLISTSSPITVVPGESNWCNSACAERRGVGFSEGGSQALGLVTTDTWKESGLYEIPLPDWYADTILANTTNHTLGGVWGLTNVGLGETSPQSPVLPGRAVVKYNLQDDFFLGSFGLAVGEIGSTGATTTTFLSEYEIQHAVTSSSYGYGAGAYYRNNGKGVPGSLILGGYDQSRMTDQGYSISMPNERNTTLVVGVPSITYAPFVRVDSSTYSFTLENNTSTPNGFLANIDSTVPFLVLPDAICDRFQDSFKLGYDADLNLYTVSNSSHDYNKQQNATVTFKIGDKVEDSIDFASITLPYAAFDLQYGDATGEEFVNYFPIKKSKDGVYVLGRTFLQEAYIVVDYERSNFTVAPAKYADPMPAANIVTIFNETYVPAAGSSGSGLAPGAIAGTVVGIVVAFAIAGIAAFCWWKKRKSKKEAAAPPYNSSQIDPTIAGQEIKHRRVSELTGSDVPHSPKTPIAGYYSADHKSIPPISEMSPDSPPVELYSPPPESTSDVDGNRGDYFTAGKPHRRGAQRDRASSGHNTPGTPPIAELPGDEGRFYTPGTQFDGVSPLNSPLHSRGPSDTSNIDQRLADHKKNAARPVHPAETSAAEEVVGSPDETQPSDTAEAAKERRPSHQRGLSDTTIASDSTAVSQPTPEEQERWAKERGSPQRPLSQ